MNKFSRIILISVFSLAAMFLAACNAALPAGAEASVSQDGQSAQVEFTGVVDTISADRWVVSGQTLLVNAQTTIDGVFAAGDPVKVYATITSDGAVTANKLESPSADDSASSSDDSQPLPGTFDDSGNEYFGLVETINAASWAVSGQTFAVNAQTEFKDNILVGDSVKVHFTVNSDGTYTATEIELAVDLAQDGSQDDSQNDPSDLEITGKVEAFTAEAWTVKGQEFKIDAQTEIKDNILLGDVVKVHYFVNAEGSLTAREIELAGANQAHNSEKKLTGILQQLTPTQATIGGVVVLITDQTIHDSGLVIGEMVKAEVVTNPDGSMTALEIETFNNSSSGNDDNSGSGNSGKGSGNSGSGSDDSDDSDDDKGTPEPGDDNSSDD